MEKPILKVTNVSKQYRLGNIGIGTLKEDLIKLSYKIRGKENPFLKFGEVNDRTNVGTSQYVWALKDINFEINRGDVLGVIGKNGAGKSTLLKILSKITGPTTGSIQYDGKVASLLEVGTGFNGELTGRENIYLNGAILGMTKKEISSKIDEIIEFSGCERYVDTPVKRYSSGMTVRLAFAVAAFLEPDILIVDEVLAVGDAEFQKKAIGKMKDISNETGRTVLFVSHNMAAVRRLCTKGIVLENGTLTYTGTANDAVNYYLSLGNDENDEIESRVDRVGSGKIKVKNIHFYNKENLEVNEVISGDYLKMKIVLQKNEEIDYQKLFFGVGFNDVNDLRVVSFFSDEMGSDFSFLQNKNEIILEIPSFAVRSGILSLTFQLSENGTRKEDWLDCLENAKLLNVLPGDFWNTGVTNREGAYALLSAKIS